MIGLLPKSLEINGTEYRIRSDFRVALLIFEAFNDSGLNDYEKIQVCLECLYEKIPEDTEMHTKKRSGFLTAEIFRNQSLYAERLSTGNRTKALFFQL